MNALIFVIEAIVGTGRGFSDTVFRSIVLIQIDGAGIGVGVIIVIVKFAGLTRTELIFLLFHLKILAFSFLGEESSLYIIADAGRIVKKKNKGFF